MRDYLHLHSLIFNTPHLCTPEYAETVLAVVGGKFGIQEGLFQVKNEAKEAKDKNFLNGVQVIPIQGSMVHKGSQLDTMSGTQSYQSIQANIQEALDNPSVNSILLDWNSSGGSVAGAFDLKDFIAEAKQIKPIYSLANDDMASAAYLIASAATEVYATQTSRVGSIGVVAMHMDRSEANKKEGVKPTFIYAGDYKVAGNPHEKLEGDALNYLQESVNDSYDMFVEAVAKNRDISEDVVRDTQARVYRGGQAKKLGLIDDVMSYDALIKKLANQQTTQRAIIKQTSYKSKGLKMEDKELTLEADAKAVSEQMNKLDKENQELKSFLISNGFRITSEGVEKVAKDDKPAEELMEFGGETINLAALPTQAADVIRKLAAEKADTELTKLASAELPHFALSAAKELMSAKLSETSMQALKAADKMLASMMEETGKVGASGEMMSNQEAFDALVKKTMQDKDVSLETAKSMVTESPEGRKLQKLALQEKE